MIDSNKKLKRMQLSDALQGYPSPEAAMPPRGGWVRAIREALGMTQALAQTWGSLGEIGRKTLPETVLSQGMLDISVRRLRLLPESEQVLMILAALYGREIDLAYVRKLDSEANLDAWMVRGINVALITTRAGSLRFSYDKMREGLLHLARPEDYRRAALAVEAIYPDDLNYFGRLYTWWWAAGEVAMALRYAQRECENLVRRGEYKLLRRLVDEMLTATADAALLPSDALSASR